MKPHKVLVVDDEGARLREAIAKAVVVGTLADAKEQGASGTVGCAGCSSTRGTLEGKTFHCRTKGCKYEQHPTPSHPWSKK